MEYDVIMKVENVGLGTIIRPVIKSLSPALDLELMVANLVRDYPNHHYFFAKITTEGI